MTEFRPMPTRPTTAEAWLVQCGLRPTRPRAALAHRLITGGDRHFTAEELFAESRDSGDGVSLATVYNALKQFVEAGMIRRVDLGGSAVYYDTRTDDHPHYFWEEEGRLEDAPVEAAALAALAPPPEGARISGVDVVIRLRCS